MLEYKTDYLKTIIEVRDGLATKRYICNYKYTVCYWNC